MQYFDRIGICHERGKGRPVFDGRRVDQLTMAIGIADLYQTKRWVIGAIPHKFGIDADCTSRLGGLYCICEGFCRRNHVVTKVTKTNTIGKQNLNRNAVIPPYRRKNTPH